MLEIADLPQVVRLPLAPPIVRGLVNLRGQVMPVIDLGVQSGPAITYTSLCKLVVAESAGEKLAFLSEGIPDLAEEFCGERVDVMNIIAQFRAGDS
ncbi:chemotaxis protein CheW [Geopsychrobacter electrodiphilus]|uniref:chemotaxis protein CheW n=1 Tax=Geopsychrobacter electrodiphilus TaxID=225196 RepID=UPI003CCBFB7B